MTYQPPCTITPAITNLLAEISETIGRYTLPAYLPVEAVIRDRQEDYYRILAVADSQADATPFVEFMPGALRDAVAEAVSTDQVTDQVTALIQAIGSGEQGSNDLMQVLGLSRLPTFRNNYLNPAMKDGWIERTRPDPTLSVDR